jgi:hypothetical protein
MRNLIICLAALLFMYSCSEISGKETPRPSKTNLSADENAIRPPDELRVGKVEAGKMRSRRQKDDAIFKISARDLQSLVTGGGANDSFVFFLVKYDVNSEKEKARYLKKVPNVNWNDIGKKPSGLLVGYLKSNTGTMNLSRSMFRREVDLYDLSVVCPPPPDCDCDIAQ